MEHYEIFDAEFGKACKLEFNDGYTMHSFEKDLPAMHYIISAKGQDISLADLSLESALPKDSVHSIPAAPVGNNYLQQPPHTKRYGLGLCFLDMECVLNRREMLRTAVITPLLEEFYSRSGETVSAAI